LASSTKAKQLATFVRIALASMYETYRATNRLGLAATEETAGRESNDVPCATFPLIALIG
jgi:hypothetical protein